MVTFSDMVTLLLTFFVLLLSMANMDKIKFKDAASSIRGAFGVMNGSNPNSLAPPSVVEFTPIEDDYMARLYQRVQAVMARLKLDRDIELVKDRGAVVLRIKDSILFAAGGATLRPEAHTVLAKVADLVRPLPLSLRIEGHSDDTPTGNGDFSNWDLSIARSTAVLKFLGKENLLPLDRMSSVGYGAQKPLVPNISAENRALNRRVEFVLENVGSYREELPYLIDANDQLPF
jgi:chemotaxis protein MotB